MKSISEKAFAQPQWEKESVFLDGDSFFASVFAAIENSQTSIKLEVYILKIDPIGLHVESLLIAAAKRGVHVQLLIDGFGSYDWIQQRLRYLIDKQIRVQVFHPMPSSFFHFSKRYLPTAHSLWSLLLHINHRNHRKMCIVDKKTAWVGSYNLCAEHSIQFMQSAAWRDTGICVEGPGVTTLIEAYDFAWKAADGFLLRSLKRLLPRQIKLIRRQKSHDLVRRNDTRKLRLQSQKDLFYRIRHAEQRVWITTAYFIPIRKLMFELQRAAKRKIDICLLFPKKSDIWLTRVMSRYFYGRLLRSGVRIYEYTPNRVLHAKTLCIDDWHLVSTSNMNHRSFLYDIEIDITVTHPESKQVLETAFLQDLEQSQQITLLDWSARSFWEKLLSRILLYWRHWM